MFNGIFSISATSYSLVQCGLITGPRTACGPRKHSGKVFKSQICWKAYEVTFISLNCSHWIKCICTRTMNNTFSVYQNRRQKVFNRGLCSSAGELCVCAGGLDIIKLTKIPLIYRVSLSIWCGLEICLGGLSPPNPPVATGLLCTIIVLVLFIYFTIKLEGRQGRPVPPGRGEGDHS